MARDISQLHPRLQTLANKLVEECKKQGIKIIITECLRTVAEQDALYAKGRTAPGSIVTNARGSSYSSMHQWGVAFDFILDMDIDGDGKTSDDIYNNNKGTFNKVGNIGKKLGLEWGGDWKSIKDLPHFQLPDWGSTTSKLKSTYKTPEAFKKTWKSNGTGSNKSTPNSSKKVASATIKKGTKGEDVKLLQKNLNSVMKSGLAVDGVFGDKGVVALKAFQKKYGLTVDGIYGAKCEAKMKTLVK